VSGPGEPAAGNGRSQAVARIAHRVRNPLAVLVGYAELLRARDDAATRREAAARIVEAANAVAEIADDVLALLALELDAVELELEAVRLGDAVAAAAERIAERTGVDVPSLAEGAELVVEADVVRLERMIANLLLAVTEDAPATGRLFLAARAEPPVAALRVRKAGWRASPEDLEALVGGAARPNERANGTQVTGFELYEAARLAKLHGGSCGVEHEANGTPALVVRLPLAGTHGP
jgi:signal transduction histidine kinase